MVGVEVTALGVDPYADAAHQLHRQSGCELPAGLGPVAQRARREGDGRIPHRARPPAAAGHLRRVARARHPVHREPGDQPADRAGDALAAAEPAQRRGGGPKGARAAGRAATPDVRIRGGRPRRRDPGRGGGPRRRDGDGRRRRPGPDQRRRRRGRTGPGRRAPQAAGARPRVDPAQRGVDHDLLDRQRGHPRRPRHQPGTAARQRRGGRHRHRVRRPEHGPGLSGRNLHAGRGPVRGGRRDHASGTRPEPWRTSRCGSPGSAT